MTTTKPAMTAEKGQATMTDRDRAEEEALAWGESWDPDDWQPRSTSMDD